MADQNRSEIDIKISVYGRKLNLIRFATVFSSLGVIFSLSSILAGIRTIVSVDFRHLVCSWDPLYPCHGGWNLSFPPRGAGCCCTHRVTETTSVELRKLPRFTTMSSTSFLRFPERCFSSADVLSACWFLGSTTEIDGKPNHLNLIICYLEAISEVSSAES